MEEGVHLVLADESVGRLIHHKSLRAAYILREPYVRVKQCWSGRLQRRLDFQKWSYTLCLSRS